VAGFLARNRGNTRAGYRTDLRCWFTWWFSMTWPSSTPAEFIWSCGPGPWKNTDTLCRYCLPTSAHRRRVYQFAVIDGHLLHSPAEHVRCPKPDHESTTLRLDRMG
jgi:hypothetical protein